MSASPTNASVGFASESPEPHSLAVELSAAKTSSRDALQALLAFSALHDQIRRRRAGENQDPWELEQFVLGEVLQLVAERAIAITGADGVAIALAEGENIICRASAGDLVPDRGACLNPSSGFSGYCFRSGKVVRCDDAESDERVNLETAQRLGVRSLVAVPLSGQKNVLGIIEAFSRDAFAFNDTDVRSLSLLAELILSAMQPEEEDRLAEISRKVAAGSTASEKSVQPTEIAEPESIVQPKEIEADPVLPRQPVSAHAAEPASIEQTRIEPAPTQLTVDSGSGLPGLRVVVAIVLFAAALGAVGWWAVRGRIEPAHAVLVPNPETKPTTPAQAISAEEPAITEDVPSPEEPSSNSAQRDLSVLPKVMGIRHWSSADSSTVVIDLQDQVQYEAHRLTNPDRIYFDLHDTGLAPGITGKPLDINDNLISRVRVAQPITGVTRVVLETKASPNFSVSMETNPYRLVVEVRAVGSAPLPRSSIDLFAPAAPQHLAGPSATLPVSESHARTGTPTFSVVLDAGHGGWDLGTVGRDGLMEKDLVLDIVSRLGTLLQNRLGADVIYTRESDTYVPLEKRTEIANQVQADFFVSVHANYSNDPNARGVETYYTNTFSSANARYQDDQSPKLLGVSFANVDIRAKVTDSHRFASSVQHALYAALAVRNPGIRNRGVKEASYVVLTGTTMPAILTEISFVSSPADERKLEDSAYRQEIAQALYNGISRYAAANKQVKLASTSGKPTGR